MTPLSNQQKELLFHYCIQITSHEEIAEAEALIASSEEAENLYRKFKAALSPLDSIEPELCPDELVEGTIWRLNNHARSGDLKLRELLAAEQAQTAAGKGYFWRNFGSVAAVAAVVLIALAVWQAPLSFARQQYWQQRCQAQLAGIGQGLKQYSADHDGQMPTMTTASGEPWWKVGYQGRENHSATRSMWLLVKGRYVNQADFVCPGAKQGTTVAYIEPGQAQKYCDFPGRKYVTYSIRIRCDRAKAQPAGRKVLIADLSPLFEKLPRDFSQPFKLELDGAMLVLNSVNHNRRGQNLLYCDGSVEFVKSRTAGVPADDIFTLRDIKIYYGYEVPSCEEDAFLAP